MTDDAFPLFHWAPTARRKQITRYGLRPSMWSRDRAWRPPYVCFSADPEMAWGLSGMMDPDVSSWDLWLMLSDVPSGYEEIWNTVRGTGEQYVQEVRVYERIWKRDLWYVATRTQT